MCLKACRRLPLNAPCVSLRLTSFTPEVVVSEAAKALLSGGAHPILFHDDRMVQGISNDHESYTYTIRQTVIIILLQDFMKYSVNHTFAQVYQSRMT